MEHNGIKKAESKYFYTKTSVQSTTSEDNRITLADNVESINGKFYPLQRFFSGKLEEYQIAAFTRLRLNPGCFEPIYLTLDKIVVLGPTKRLVILWQFTDVGEIHFINVPVTDSLTNFKLSDFMPARMHATKLAIVTYTEEMVNIKCIYLLTGTVTDTDPVHDLLRNRGNQPPLN